MPMTPSIKRVEDLAAFSLSVVVFTAPFLLIMLLIYLEDRQRVFFIQARVGQRGRVFQIVKFRTMNAGEITRVGRWLRKTGLDELPQFINILRGEMSVVGPRPLTPFDIERLGWTNLNLPRYRVKPGMTGLAQILAGAGARRSKWFDRIYAERMSLSLDVRIMGLTFVMTVIGKSGPRSWLRRVK